MLDRLRVVRKPARKNERGEYVPAHVLIGPVYKADRELMAVDLRILPTFISRLQEFVDDPHLAQAVYALQVEEKSNA